MDERIKMLAKNLVNYSCKVGKGGKRSVCGRWASLCTLY